MRPTIAKAIINCFRIPDLRRRILITLLALSTYRICARIPALPIDTSRLMGLVESSNLLRILYTVHSAGALDNFSIVTLGVLPYVIVQSLFYFYPIHRPDELKRRRIREWRGYCTAVVSILLASLVYWVASRYSVDIHSVSPFGRVLTAVQAILGMTTGSVLVMWMVEFVHDRGIGNGASLIIFSNSCLALSRAITQHSWSLASLGIFAAMSCVMIFVVLLLTQSARKVPVSYAKPRSTTRRRIYGSEGTYMPIPVVSQNILLTAIGNYVILIGFLQLPYYLFLKEVPYFGWYGRMIRIQSIDSLPGISMFTISMLFFYLLHTTSALNPYDIAHRLQMNQGVIPGIRPGRMTAALFDMIITRLTLAGAMMLIGLFICVRFVYIFAPGRLPFEPVLWLILILYLTDYAVESSEIIHAHLSLAGYRGFLSPST